MSSENENIEYYTTLDRLFEDLYKQVDWSELFDAPEGGWRCVITYDSYGVELLLDKVEFDRNKYDRLCLEYDSDYYTEKNFWDATEVMEQFSIFSASAKMLTAEEFSQKCGACRGA